MSAASSRATAFPKAKIAPAARAVSSLLEPGEQRTFVNKLTVLPDAEAVAAMRNRVADLRTSGQPVPIDLSDYDPS